MKPKRYMVHTPDFLTFIMAGPLDSVIQFFDLDPADAERRISIDCAYGWTCKLRAPTYKAWYIRILNDHYSEIWITEWTDISTDTPTTE
jgi:hypothetical protein